MLTWQLRTLIHVVFLVLLIVLLFILIRKKRSKPATQDMVTTDVDEWNQSPSFIQEMTLHQNLDEPGLNRSNHHVFRKGKSFFSWADHPSLLADAVENGWPPFSFKPAANSHLSDHGNGSNMMTNWEVFDESAEFMQKMRLNPGVGKSTTTRSSVIRTALPFPGPQFANASFPQEAYFEVTILPNKEHVETNTNQLDRSEGHMRKLIGEDSNENNTFEFSNLIHSKRKKIEEVKTGGKESGIVLMGIGLTGGNHLPQKFPGSFPGSVGFNSTGSLYLDGMKLAPESENNGWGRVGDVIGCGYNPAYKKVFFTLNSKLINQIHCKTEEYGHPLYPTLAANIDVTVVVNLGQSPFKFEAANSKRISNPCFITRPPGSSTAPHNYDLDSKELFSMGRINDKWKDWATTIAINSESTNVESDLVSEADLFEIAVR